MVFAATLSSPGVGSAAPEDSAGEATEARPLAWRWQQFRSWEYPTTGVALGAAFTLRYGAPSPSADWKGGILLDDWVQDHFSIQNIRTRAHIVTLTDVAFFGSMGYRLVDSAFIPSVIWHNPELAWQMSMIDLESFGFVAITLWGGQAVFGRERPYAKRCNDPAFAEAEPSCEPNSDEHNRSFYAGHPAVVLTAAGLTCTHHAHLPLYGGGLAEPVTCGAMIGAAALTGVGRIVTEKHHFSDVIVGFAVGAFAGWFMPEFLHYRYAKPVPVKDEGRSKTMIHATLVPMIGEREAGLQCIGLF